MIRFAAAVLFAVSATVGAAAAESCSSKFFEGVWVGHASTEVDLYCLLELNKNGATRQSSCFSPKSLKATATLDGKLTLGEDCKVTGTFELTINRTGKSDPAAFKGRLVPEKGAIVGDFVIFGEGEAYKFTKQLD
jgi:hypothetical protein